MRCSRSGQLNLPRVGTFTQGAARRRRGLLPECCEECPTGCVWVGWGGVCGDTAASVGSKRDVRARGNCTARRRQHAVRSQSRRTPRTVPALPPARCSPPAIHSPTPPQTPSWMTSHLLSHTAVDATLTVTAASSAVFSRSTIVTRAFSERPSASAVSLPIPDEPPVMSTAPPWDTAIAGTDVEGLATASAWSEVRRARLEALVERRYGRGRSVR
jgi:hypothetical protein